ncbi:hypothetical protein [Roseburia sp. 1XD42-34]|nr:hypothetical protein [Roseburia sp. 1XD42-34]
MPTFNDVFKKSRLLMGAGTASYQCAGAWNKDGRSRWMGLFPSS